MIFIEHYQIEKNNMNEMNDVLSVILDYFRLNKEKLIMDYTKTMIEHFYATFRKALKCEIIYFLRG